MDNRQLDELIKQYINGSEAAFEEIYYGTHKQVYALIYSIVNNRSSADELLQETYVKFIQNLHSYKVGSNSKAFLLTIAKNLSINEYNRLKKYRNIDLQEEEYHLAGEGMDDVSTPTLDLAKEILSEDEYKIFIYHVVSELKHKEIAELLNKPIGTVLWIYNKSIKKMKNEIEKRGVKNFIQKDL